MQRSAPRRIQPFLRGLANAMFCVAMGLCGCASPGPPRAPSLGLPHPVTDLAASRVGDVVELRFTVPSQTSDGLPLRAKTVNGSVCRQIGPNAPCLAVDGNETRTPLQVPGASGRAANPTLWTDRLPPELNAGAPRLLLYRVTLRDAMGRAAGASDPVAAAAGAAPPAVTDFQAEGTRRGVALRWTPLPSAGEVLIERIDSTAWEPAASRSHAGTSRAPRAGAAQRAQGSGSVPARKTADPPGTVWLQAAPGNASAAATVDGTVAEAVPYRYCAVRRRIMPVGGHTLELRSAPSLVTNALWRDVYPPAAPRGLSALGYTDPGTQRDGNDQQGKERYAVDLIWQPVEDTRLAGYLVYRQGLDTEGGPRAKVRLTPQPVATPGFHDATALANRRYRYSVSAIDPKSNESGTADTVVEPFR